MVTPYTFIQRFYVYLLNLAHEFLMFLMKNKYLCICQAVRVIPCKLNYQIAYLVKV